MGVKTIKDIVEIYVEDPQTAEDKSSTRSIHSTMGMNSKASTSYHPITQNSVQASSFLHNWEYPKLEIGSVSISWRIDNDENVVYLHMKHYSILKKEMKISGKWIDPKSY